MTDRSIDSAPSRIAFVLGCTFDQGEGGATVGVIQDIKRVLDPIAQEHTETARQRDMLLEALVRLYESNRRDYIKVGLSPGQADEMLANARSAIAACESD